MDFFGIGPLELLIILVVALLVFGPKKLPEIGSVLGKAIREFRKATTEISQNISREMEASKKGLEETQKDLEKTASEINKNIFVPGDGTPRKE